MEWTANSNRHYSNTHADAAVGRSEPSHQTPSSTASLMLFNTKPQSRGNAQIKQTELQKLFAAEKAKETGASVDD